VAFNITLTSSLIINGWFHVTDACAFSGTDGATQYYIVQGTGSMPPIQTNLYAGNRIYIDSTITKLLGSGEFVIQSGTEAHLYNLVSGVVQSSVPVLCERENT
jgi:hypothetical protein